MDILYFVENLRPNELVSITSLVKKFKINKKAATIVFNELLKKGFIVKRADRDFYIYSPKRYRNLMERKYGKDVIASLLDLSIDSKIPEGMKVNEYFKLLDDDSKDIYLVFLDIDGVLNSRDTTDKCGPYRGIDDEKVLFLKEIVDSIDAKIVLISSWRLHWYKNKTLKFKQDDLANYLDEKLAKVGLEVWDKLRMYDSMSEDRGLRIKVYLNESRKFVRRYVILDDESFDYKKNKLGSVLVKTDFEKGGLNKRHVNRAIKILTYPN